MLHLIDIYINISKFLITKNYKIWKERRVKKMKEEKLEEKSIITLNFVAL